MAVYRLESVFFMRVTDLAIWYEHRKNAGDFMLLVLFFDNLVETS